MNFIKEKTEFLLKKDRSRKGEIDIKIKKLVDKINSKDNFFTTSSCSGRFLILSIPKSNKKNKVKYLFCSHKKTTFKEINKLLKEKLPKQDIWLEVQPAIIHLACNDQEKLMILLNTARDIGFRRSGIISITKNKLFAELISTEKINAIISKDGKLLIEDSYLKILVEEGNKKLGNTWKKINKLLKKMD